MDEAAKLVKEAAKDAASHDDFVGDGTIMPRMFGEDDLEHPIDEVTLDERASTQMGPLEARRYDADE